MKTSLKSAANDSEPIINTENGDFDISDMTKSELLAYAAENGIEGISGDMKKADIIKAIEVSM